MPSNRSRALPAAWLEELNRQARELDEKSLRRSIVTLETGHEPRVVAGGKAYVLFTSNNYLGLATHPRVVEAAVEATRKYGASASASRLLCGSTPLHGQLEEELASLKGQEACLLFSSGYLANLAVSALAGPEDAIFSDQLNHASIIDGCRLARAALAVYRHGDPGHLETLLRTTPARRRLIVSETVFSMDGDLAPVPELVELAGRHGALLVLDEAHCTGMLGKDGSGALSHFGLEDSPVVIIGTLSKALGSMGGFIASQAPVIEHMKNRARSFIFNTALVPGAVGAALASLRLVHEEPWRRIRALGLAETLRQAFAQKGFPPTRSTTQIVPVLVGEAEAALELDRRLRASGILTRAIRPPTVPEGTCRVRFNVMATHTEEDIRRVIEAVGTPVGAGS